MLFMEVLLSFFPFYIKTRSTQALSHLSISIDTANHINIANTIFRWPPLAFLMATPSIPTIVRVQWMLFQHRFYLLDSLGALLEQHLVVMAAESIWPGMFQAKAGGGIASVRSTRDAISLSCVMGDLLNVTRLPAMPYPTNKGQGKRFWTTGNEPQ
jgi:hypothetical protein